MATWVHHGAPAEQTRLMAAVAAALVVAVLAALLIAAAVSAMSKAAAPGMTLAPAAPNAPHWDDRLAALSATTAAPAALLPQPSPQTAPVPPR